MRIGILGGGVAGLSAAHFLNGKHDEVELFEASDFTGGLARSFEWHGVMCDLAPHRLFTEDEELLKEMLALVPMNEMRRYSQIFIRNKWIGDPVNAAEIMMKFFPVQAIKIALTFLRTKFQKGLPEDNFEELVISKFGTGLNEFFFKPYSEKLFGIPCNEISAAWGRRKIRVAGVKDMIKRHSRLYFKTFHYPKEGGYGAICEELHRESEDIINLNTKLVGIELPSSENQPYLCRFEGPNGAYSREYDVLINTLPISMISKMMGLELELEFRPAKLVYLLLDKPRLSQNHWFYFADYDRVINRVAEFKNFGCRLGQGGAEAAKNKTVVCCEVTEVNRYSLEAVTSCLVDAGLIEEKQVLDHKTIDIDLAYPIYDTSYEEQMGQVEAFYAKHPRIHHVGRHAQFAHRDIDEIFEEAKRVSQVLGEVGETKEIAAKQPASV